MALAAQLIMSRQTGATPPPSHSGVGFDPLQQLTPCQEPAIHGGNVLPNFLHSWDMQPHRLHLA
eukprot:5722015-Amphidinium_carterae.1